MNFPDEPLLACFVFIFHVYHPPEGIMTFKYINSLTLFINIYNVRVQDSHYIGVFYDPKFV